MRIAALLDRYARIFLDTAPVIYYVERNPHYLERAAAVFNRIDAGRLLGAASAVTLAECLVLPHRLGKLEVVRTFTKILTESPGATFVPLDAVLADRAAGIRARHNLPLLDAIQVASALTANCDALITNDTTLKRVTELEIIVLDEVES